MKVAVLGTGRWGRAMALDLEQDPELQERGVRFGQDVEELRT